jgi:hypothetical protein
MNKPHFLFFTLLLALVSFNFTPSKAAVHKKSFSKYLKCQVRNSSKCKNPDYFLKENKMGCAKKSGNCRHKFCKYNCLTTPQGNLYDLCLEHCTHVKTMARFSTRTRTKMYDIYFKPLLLSEDLSESEAHRIRKQNVFTASAALNLETETERTLSPIIAYRNKRKNIDLSNKLWRQYKEAVKQLSPAEAKHLKGHRRSER